MAARAAHLVADQQHAVAGIGQPRREVVEHAARPSPCPRPTRPRTGPGGLAQLARRERLADLGELPGIEHLVAPAPLGPHLVAALRERAPVDAQRGQRHRAVDEDRQPRDAAGFGQRAQLEQHDLGAVHGERGDHDHAAARRRLAHRRGQLAPARRPRRARDRRRSTRSASSRRRAPAREGAAAGAPVRPRSPLTTRRRSGGPSSSSVTDAAPRMCPARVSARRTPGAISSVAPVRERLDHRRRLRPSSSRVERQRGVVLREARAVREARVLLLEAPAVGQHDRRQLGGSARREHGAAEAGAHQRAAGSRSGPRARASARRRARLSGRTGNGSQLRRRSAFSPWNRPQSTSTCARGVVTQEAAPRHGAGRAEEAQRRACRRAIRTRSRRAAGAGSRTRARTRAASGSGRGSRAAAHRATPPRRAACSTRRPAAGFAGAPGQLRDRVHLEAVDRVEPAVARRHDSARKGAGSAAARAGPAPRRSPRTWRSAAPESSARCAAR